MPGGLPWITFRLRMSLWFIGFRFGEATHPGPSSVGSSVTLAVVNPTTILDKEWQMNQVGADVLIASETSANARVQQIMSHRFRGLGFSCLWGHPTETRHHTTIGKAMLRSYALGVAAFSKLPCRPAVQPLPDHMSMSCRISECFVRLHCVEIKIISVYGVPRCLPEAAQRNNLLLAWAYQRATVSCVPALVAGDFNTCPTDLPAWQAFQGLGWVELGAFAAQVHDIHLPCTCKGATRFDTFLLPPSLFQYFSSADVLTDDHLFDSHAPMRLHLRLPGRSPPKWLWPMPRSFQGLLLDETSAEPSYAEVSCPLQAVFADSTPESSPGDKLRLWSVAVEEAVSSALRKEHLDSPGKQCLRGLPRAFTGRCKATQRVQATPATLPRKGRQGDPEPFAEDTSVLGRQRLRQLRRLTTYGQGLARHLRGDFRGPKCLDGWPISLDKEWAAISRASGYGRSFATWVLQWPCFSHFPLQRPSKDFVEDLVSFVRFDVEAVQKQVVATKCRLFKFQLQVDAKEFGGSRSFVRVRAPEKPPFTCVLVQSSQPATVVERHSHQHVTFTVPDPSRFELLSQASFAQVHGQVTQVRGNCISLLFSSEDDIVLPARGLLSRSRHDTSWKGVVGSLMEFWSPIWNRDSPSASQDIEEWPQYRSLVHMLRSPCPELQVDMLDTEAWVHVARKLSPSKATGPCGWHNKDLRMLPRAAIADLATIMAGYLSLGFPEDVMRARVAVLSKVLTPDSASQARPITILSCLYRLWARVLCTQVLATWSFRLPSSIVGCLKGRSALDLSYSVQALVEESLLSAADLSGFCLDLRKAFNYLPRAPLADLMKRLGIPSEIVDCWCHSLARVQRAFQIGGSLGPPLGSRTGAPEGDPVSVLGMIAVCWLFVSLLQDIVEPKAYVDNLSWTSDAPDNHAPALLVLQDFVDSLALQIDWQKTYQWATSPVSHQWWTDIGAAFLPQQHGLHLVKHVKELGSYYQFSKRGSAKPFQDRLLDAQLRLQKLASDPQGATVRAKVVQCGVWPFLFFGTEGLLPSLTSIGHIRSSAARAVVGPHHTMSPHAALSLLPSIQDPEVFLLCHHVSQLKRAFNHAPEAAELIWRRLLGENLRPRQVCGPAGALQALLHRNGWTVSSSGCFKGPLHCRFDIHCNSMKQIRAAIQLAWADTVQDQLVRRNGLASAPPPHVHLTQQVLAQFKPWENKFLYRHFCGAFMSGAEKQTWSRMDCDACSLCGQLDTKAHRIFSCPVLEPQRRPHLNCLEQVQAHHGHWVHLPYVSWPFEASVLQLLVSQLRLPALAAPFQGASATIFTDASALHTSCPSARLTAWAAVVGSCPTEACELMPPDMAPDKLVQTFAVIAQGCTPGQQTVPRAELTAIVWVSRWLSLTPHVRATVYSDCQPAIDLWTKWVSSGWSAVCNCANADLLRDCPRPPDFQLRKIKAHRSPAEIRSLSPWHQWLAAGNTAADETAKAARAAIAPALLDMAQTVADHCAHEQHLLVSFCRALLDLGVLEVQQRKASAASLTAASLTTDLTLNGFLERVRQRQAPALRYLPFPAAWEEDWSSWKFGLAYGQKLLAWLQSLIWPMQPVPAAAHWQVTYVELLLHFCVWTSTMPVVENVFSPGNYWSLPAAHAQLQHVNLRMLVTVFRASLMKLPKVVGFPVLPCVDLKQVEYAKVLNLSGQCPGLAERPFLPGMAWIDTLEGLATSEHVVHYLLQMPWT